MFEQIYRLNRERINAKKKKSKMWTNVDIEKVNGTFHLRAELQIRGGIEDNSKIILLISQ